MFKFILKVTLLPVLFFSSISASAVTVAEIDVCAQQCDKLFSKLRKYAFNGSPQAQTILAQAFTTGELIDKDSDQAWRWMKKAMRQSYSPALHMVSSWYRQGLNTIINRSKADKYLAQAVKRNYPPAILALAELQYQNNNYEEAQRLFEKASRLGNDDARQLLRQLDFQPDNVLASVFQGGQNERGDNRSIDFQGESLLVVASKHELIIQLDNLLTEINGLGIYNRRGTTGSRVNNLKCGQIGAGTACRAITREAILGSGATDLNSL